MHSDLTVCCPPTSAVLFAGPGQYAVQRMASDPVVDKPQRSKPNVPWQWSWVFPWQGANKGSVFIYWKTEQHGTYVGPSTLPNFCRGPSRVVSLFICEFFWVLDTSKLEFDPEVTRSAFRSTTSRCNPKNFREPTFVPGSLACRCGRGSGGGTIGTARQ